MSLSSGSNIKSFNWPARRRSRTAHGHAREVKRGDAKTAGKPIDSNFSKTEDAEISAYFRGGAPVGNRSKGPAAPVNKGDVVDGSDDSAQPDDDPATASAIMGGKPKRPNPFFDKSK